MADTVVVERPLTVAVPPRRMSLGAQIGITHLAFAHNFLWTALLLVVVPAQVVAIAGEKNKTSALAGVLIVGALIAATSQIVGGGLSDRATFRLGRRRPFILGGAAIAALGLYLMSLAHTIPLLAAAFLVLQFGFNIGQAAYAALIPDRVPAAQRGSASGLLGLMVMLGAIAGVGLVRALIKDNDFASFSRVYMVIIAVNVLLTVTTALALREEPQRRVAPFELGAFVRGMWIDPRETPDFSWVFITRFLVMMGYFTVFDFLYYYVRDELGHHNALNAVALISLAVILAAAATVFFAGHISDRVGRKPVVYASAGLMAGVSLAFIVTHSLGLAMAVGAVWGLGWGAYQSVDWALATDALPRPTHANGATSFARYMGIWSLAVTIPQVLSPAIGPFVDLFNHHASGSGYTLMFVVVFLYFLLGAVLVRKVRNVR